MPYVQMTLVQPMLGKETAVTALLKKLDGVISPTPGMLFSAVINDKDVPTAARRVGRISVWQSLAQAQSEATSDRILAIRAEIHRLSQTVVMESLFDISAGWFPMTAAPGKLHVAIPEFEPSRRGAAAP
jgi:hypothetical protein